MHCQGKLNRNNSKVKLKSLAFSEGIEMQFLRRFFILTINLRA